MLLVSTVCVVVAGMSAGAGTDEAELRVSGLTLGVIVWFAMLAFGGPRGECDGCVLRLFRGYGNWSLGPCLS